LAVAPRVHGRLAQLVRVLARHARGQWFESTTAHHTKGSKPVTGLELFGTIVLVPWLVKLWVRPGGTPSASWDLQHLWCANSRRTFSRYTDQPNAWKYLASSCSHLEQRLAFTLPHIGTSPCQAMTSSRSSQKYS
jgi:hypothetical protein